MDLFDILGLHVGCGVPPTQQGLMASLTRQKSHLGGLLGWRSHGSVVSTACSNSLVSLNSRRTNREEEAKKPHITTITAASGTENKKGLLQSQPAQKRRGHKKRKRVADTLTQKRVSVTHEACSFCGFMQTCLQSQSLWSSSETWVFGWDLIPQCMPVLRSTFMTPCVSCDTECMKDWDKTMGFVSNYRWLWKKIHKNDTKLISYITVVKNHLWVCWNQIYIYCKEWILILT